MRQSVIHETNANTTSFGFKGSLKSLKCIFDECIKCYNMSLSISYSLFVSNAVKYKENYLKHIELYKLMICVPITIDDASHYMK